jgi:RNA polymerase sigma factor (TIGR02999 family)
MASSQEIDLLLRQIRAGDKAAFDRLLPLVYPELHRIAKLYFRRERLGHTLQTTALVHEAYLRLVNQRLADCEDRAHFLGIAAFLMRRILVNHARGRQSAKRGNDPVAVTLDDVMAVTEQRADDMLAVDQALTRLANLDSEQARLVEMHFFGGMGFDEIAVALGISVSTAKRRWASARAWLSKELGGMSRAQSAGPA